MYLCCGLPQVRLAALQGAGKFQREAASTQPQHPAGHADGTWGGAGRQGKAGWGGVRGVQVLGRERVEQRRVGLGEEGLGQEEDLSCWRPWSGLLIQACGGCTCLDPIP